MRWLFAKVVARGIRRGAQETWRPAKLSSAVSSRTISSCEEYRAVFLLEFIVKWPKGSWATELDERGKRTQETGIGIPHCRAVETKRARLESSRPQVKFIRDSGEWESERLERRTELVETTDRTRWKAKIPLIYYSSTLAKTNKILQVAMILTESVLVFV